MAPAWLVPDVEIAYRLSQALGSIAFSAAAFPAYVLARRVGAGTTGALGVVLVTLMTPDGMFTAGLLAEPYTYPLFLLAVIVAVDAIAAPSAGRQLAVVAAALVLPLVAGLQFAVFGVAYLVASAIACSGSPRRLVKEQGFVVGAAVLAFAGAVAALAVMGTSRIGVWLSIFSSWDFPVGATAGWVGAHLFLLAAAAGWILLPGAAVGLRGMLSAGGGRRRAFALLTLVLTVGLLLQTAPFGVNQDATVERYVFYGVPLIAVLFFCGLQDVGSRRSSYGAVAYASAFLALLVPLWGSFRAANITQSPVLLALEELPSGEFAAVIVWGPLLTALAVATAIMGHRRPAAVVVGALAVCVLLSAGSSRSFIRLTADEHRPRGTAPSGAALLTWWNADPLAVRQTVFWHPEIARVIVVGGGRSPYALVSTDGGFDPRGNLVDSEGPIRGPFVADEDVLAADRLGAAREGSRLLTLVDPPLLVAQGWHRRLGYLGTAGRIYGTGRGRDLEAVIRLENPAGVKTMDFRCSGGLERRVEVRPRPTSIVIALPRAAVEECSFRITGGAVEAVGRTPVSVKAELVLRPASR
jgi:hypothetical protein